MRRELAQRRMRRVADLERAKRVEGAESLLACCKGNVLFVAFRNSLNGVDVATKIQLFFQEVMDELKKVSWTTRRELVDSTIVVVASIFILAAIVGVLDYFLTLALDKLIH